jgi:hypothetical protein
VILPSTSLSEETARTLGFFFGKKIQAFAILDKTKELGVRRSRNGARLKANGARLNLHHRFFGKFLTEPARLKT